ncbi:MAG: hypothetical protein ACLR7D_02570 [Lachnospira eligens]
MSGYIHNLGPSILSGLFLLNCLEVVYENSKNINAGEISELPDEEYVLPYGISNED